MRLRRGAAAAALLVVVLLLLPDPPPALAVDELGVLVLVNLELLVAPERECVGQEVVLYNEGECSPMLKILVIIM